MVCQFRLHSHFGRLKADIPSFRASLVGHGCSVVSLTIPTKTSAAAPSGSLRGRPKSSKRVDLQVLFYLYPDTFGVFHITRFLCGLALQRFLIYSIHTNPMLNITLTRNERDVSGAVLCRFARTMKYERTDLPFKKMRHEVSHALQVQMMPGGGAGA